eukprot:46844_1
MTTYWDTVANIRDKWSNNKKLYSLYFSCIAIVAVPVARKYYQYLSQKRTQQKLKDYEDISTKENKVILHMFYSWPLPTPHPSPACAKMIAYFEYNKIDYILDHKMPSHPHTTKAPWITYRNEHVPDSNMIIKYIASNKSLNNIDMDHHLNKLQKATSNAFKALIEDCLYFIILYRRWCTEENSNVYIPMLLQNVKMRIPSILKSFIASKIRQTIIDMTWAQGTSRLQANDIYEKGEEVVESVLTCMGDNKFFFGDKLSSVDLSIYGHIGGMYQVPFTWNGNTNKTLPFRKEINDYMKRIEMECYGELRYWKDID